MDKKQYYHSWVGDEIPKYALGSSNYGGSRTTFKNVDGNLSGRDEFTAGDFEHFRPSSALPKKHPDIMKRCDQVYKESGLIKHIIDMMADFTFQGIRISHPIKSTERLLKEWFEKIQGVSVSERFCNYLYRYGNIIVQRHDARIPRAEYKDMKSVAAKWVIPIKYTFLNPASVKVEGDDNSIYTSSPQYYIDMPQDPKTRELLKNIPGITITGNKVYLSKDNTIVAFYRKDDWKAWATPMIYSVLKDIEMLNRLELADKTALDGAISNIRIFKLGDLENKYIPDDAAFERLEQILQSHVAGGTLDIIWGPDIVMQESASEVYKFLGKEKFVPYLEKIFISMGIPVLSGGSRGSVTGSTLSLNMLIQKLEYGRQQLRAFWREEFKKVKEALGINKMPIIEFDYPNLTDDVSYKSLLIQLADRNLISDEVLDYAFKKHPEMERVRISREESQRDDQVRARKTTPYNEGDLERFVLKTAYNKGLIKLKDLDLDYEEQEIEDNKMSGQPFQGRPKLAKDKEKRAPRTEKPARSLAKQVWANATLAKINDILRPLVLETFGKKNLRELSSDQAKKYEVWRVSALFNIEAGSELTDQEIIDKASLDSDQLKIQSYIDICNDTSKFLDRQLTLEEKNYIASTIYCLED